MATFRQTGHFAQSRRRALLAGVSMSAVLTAVLATKPIVAQSQPVFTPSWSTGARQSGGAVAGAVSAAPVFTEQQARQIQVTKANLERAAKSFRDIQVLQSAARAAALSAVRPGAQAVVDGLNTRGLWVARTAGDPYGVSSDPRAANGLVWTNAALPKETRNADGTVDVTVQQTASRALLTWQNFDIGKQTTLTFQQRDAAGTPQSSWVAFNRVVAGPAAADGSRVIAAPSQILGRIKSDGQVYVINPNGIIFGGSSQVNTSAFTASTLDIGLPYQSMAERNAYYFENATSKLRFSAQLLVNTAQTDIDQFGLLKQIVVAKTPADPRFSRDEPGDKKFNTITALAVDALEGDIVVDAGALISTSALSANNSDLGRVVLAAPNVKNSGTIATPDGQAILVASRNFSLAANNGTAIVQKAQTSIPTQPTVAEIDKDLRGVIVTIGTDDFNTASVNDPYVVGGGSLNTTIFGARKGSSAFGANIAGLAEQCFVGRCTDVSIATGLFNYDEYRTAAFLDNIAGTSSFFFNGRILSDGLITSPRGSITLRANKIDIDGVLHSTTSVNQNGLVDIIASNTFGLKANFDTRIVRGVSQQVYRDTTFSRNAPDIVFGKSAVISIQPDTQPQADGTQKTIPADDQSSQNFRPSAVRLRAADANGTEGSITLQSGSLISAPSGNVTAVVDSPILDIGLQTNDFKVKDFAPNLVIAKGATIDVAGLPDVLLPIESNLITVTRVGQNELADSPLQRNEFIYRQAVVIDQRISGVRDDGTVWRGTPLFDAAGYINNRPRLVTELMTTGGKLSFGGSVLAEPGSLLNVAGGYLRYADGYIKTTKLIGNDGKRIYDISKASPAIDYTGFAGAETSTVPRWGVTTTFTDIGQSQLGTFERGYVEGSSAGTISFRDEALSSASISLDGGTTPGTQSAFLNDLEIRSIVLLNGNLNGAAITGPNQRRGGTYFDAAKPLPTGAKLDLGNVIADTIRVTGARQAILPEGYKSGDILPSALFTSQTWSAAALSDAGFASIVFGKQINRFNVISRQDSISYTNAITFDRDANFKLADGGRLDVRAANIDIFGTITSHGGTAQFSLLNGPVERLGVLPRARFSLAADAAIDVSGNWVNDLLSNGSALNASNYLNGGTVAIIGADYVSALYDVNLSSGSIINLNSGGFVQANGRLALASNGAPIGKGGSLSLELRPDRKPSVLAVPLDTSPDAVLTDGKPNEFIDDRITLDSQIAAFGFQGGGKFTLVAPNIQIGGAPTANQKGLIYFKPEFFTDKGFGSFDLVSAFTSKLALDTTLQLRQNIWLPTQFTATAQTLAAGAVLSSLNDTLGLQRPAVNFSLQSLALTDFNRRTTSFSLDGNSFYQETSASPSANAALLFEAGSTVTGDPGALISLRANGQLTLLGDIIAPGGTVSINQKAKVLPSVTGVSPSPGNLYTDDYRAAGVSYYSFILGKDASIDVSGTFIRDIRQTSFLTGNLLSGGSVRIDADVAAAAVGSVINVSGATGTIETRVDANQSRYAPTTIYSDAGKIELAGLTPSFRPQLVGKGGGTTSAGGSLVFAGDRIVQSYDPAAPGAVPLAQLIGDKDVVTGVSIFAADLLSGSGIDAVTLNFSNRVNSSLVFDGPSSISAARSITINAPSISAVAAPLSAPAAVAVNTSYLRFIGGLGSLFDAKPLSNLMFATSSNLVDFIGTTNITGFSKASFTSTGDIRFVPVLDTRPNSSFNINAIRSANGYDYRAGLVSNSDLVLKAAQIYPATNVTAVIQSTGTAGTINFERNGAIGETPLSAGGKLVVTAATINQNGVLRAPLGEIIFGITPAENTANRYIFDTTGVLASNGLQVTGLVTTGANSLTSVSALSADGKTPLLIPYGETINGLDWLYRGVSASPLTQAPGKQIRFNAIKADLSAGGVIDASGGGDVYATEFVPGLGGRRNVLKDSLTRDVSAPVYAILPGDQVFTAPVDPQGYSSLVPDAVGRTIILTSDVPSLGLVAGKPYTLLPGNYATLKGAVRVQALPSSTQDSASNTQFAGPDGSITVAGTFGLSGSSIQSSRTIGLNLMSNETWRQYTELTTTLATPFFTNLAKLQARPPAALPADAGRLAITVADRILTGAQFKFDLAESGRGGFIDISAPKIAVVSPEFGTLKATLETGGYLVFSPADIKNFNSTAVLLGATRQNTILGDILTVGAADVRVATSAANPLTNPELVFAASTTLTVDAGSVIRATGTVPGAAAQNIIIGKAPAVNDTGTSGEGALLRVSNGTAAGITRFSVSANPLGIINIGLNPAAGVSTIVDGGKVLQVDASQTSNIDVETSLGGETIDLFSKRLAFVSTTQAGVGSIGARSLQILGNARSLTFRASDSVFFQDPLTVQASGAGRRFDVLEINAPNIIADNFAAGTALTFDATKFVFGNNYALSATTVATPGNAALRATAETIVLTGNNRVVQGFDRFDLVASKSLSLGDGGTTGILTAPVAFTLTTPLVTLAESSDQSLVTTGAFQSLAPAGSVAVPATEAIGGRFRVTADSITITNSISARAGILDLFARTGDITIGATGIIQATGYTQSFTDKDVLLPGGRVSAIADRGNFILASGARLDVSGVANGNAGSFSVITGGTGRQVMLDGTLLAQSGGGSTTGGAFLLDSSSRVDLDALATKLTTGGFSKQVIIRGAGDMTLNTALTARTVSLTADDDGNGGGRLVIGTTINASGPEGGRIDLYGFTGVDLLPTAALIALAQDATQRGGVVSIGTTLTSGLAVPQAQARGGSINLAAGSSIDVTDGAQYNLLGGSGGASVTVRAPILTQNGINFLPVTLDSRITGERNVIVEGFRRYTTSDPTSGFDGIVDPAGWFDSKGQYVAGQWVNIFGGKVAATDNEAAYFTTTTPNQAHVQFYQNTLVNAVRNPGVGFASTNASIAPDTLHFRPGIELVNGEQTINNGDISILSNWNLGAGSINPDGSLNLVYRTGADAEPGVLTVRALNDVRINASISDGFFRTLSTLENPYPVFSSTKASDLPRASVQSFRNYIIWRSLRDNGAFGSNSVPAPLYLNPQRYSDYEIGTYYRLNFEYMARAYVRHAAVYEKNQGSYAFIRDANKPLRPVTVTTIAEYPDYLVAYIAYLDKVATYNQVREAAGFTTFLEPMIPIAPSRTLNFGALPTSNVSNTIANNATYYDQIPLSYMDITTSDDSWSYRFNAGSDVRSANPNALQQVAATAVTVAGGAKPGSFILGGTPSAAAQLGPNDTIRTGTGSIDIHATGDVRFLNVTNTVYTAGTAAAPRVDPVTGTRFVDLIAAVSPRAPAFSTDFTQFEPTSNSTTISNGAGIIGISNDTVSNIYELGQSNIGRGLVNTTLPVFPAQGGDITITARGDIMMNQNDNSQVFFSVNRSDYFRSDGSDLRQFLPINGYVNHGQNFAEWLLRQGSSSASPGITGQFGGRNAYDSGPGNLLTGVYNNLQTAQWLRTGLFQQGVAALGGGNVVIKSGGSLLDASLSIASTFHATGGKSAGEAVGFVRYGGGNLSVDAGGDIGSSKFYVGKGTATVVAGGALLATSNNLDGPYSETGFDFDGNPLDEVTISGVNENSFIVGDAKLDVQARRTIAIGTVTNANWLTRIGTASRFYDSPNGAPYLLSATASDLTFSDYGLGSALSLTSSVGDLRSTSVFNLPGTVRFAATRGSIRLDSVNLAASPQGNLDLLAYKDVGFLGIKMDDRDPALTGTVLAPLQFSNIDGSDPLRTFRARVNDRFESHAAAILHKGDTAPSYIVALTGDVTGGTSERLFNLTLAEQARIFAGRDIVDIGFSGQNTGNTDITSIAAGRDITYTLTTGVGGAPKIVNGFDVGSRPVQVPVGGFYAIGGDGQFTLVAGRDLKIAPGLAADVRTVAENNLTGVTGLRTAGRAQGVLAIGNTDNGYLTGGSANVNVLFGVGPGLNIAGFVDRYINPANSASAPGTYSTQLAAFINARATAAARAQNPGTTFVSSLSAADAWAVFRTLPENQQQAFVQQVFYSEIRVAADQQNFPDQYQNFPRVYAAIETLFPAAYGYSNNSATTSTRVSTGNLDMVGASLRTDFGGDINILGPGGGATLGGLSVVDTAPPQGVLTARGGNINIFTDQNLQVNSSRIFTLLGGDITSFSSSGNIDAGRGRKTSAFFPPLQVNYAPNTTASIDSAGLITGAGIGTLQSIPGSALGNVYLLAPRGDIDAGDAGIRASGNLFVVAQRVLNADNVQIGGKSFGVPKAPVVSVTQVVGSSAKPIDPSQIDPKAGDATKGRSITQITVQVTGFGEPEDIRKKRKKTTK